MGDSKCQYCGDTGQIRTKGRVKEFRGRKIFEEDASPCVCVLNKFISERFEQLSSIPDALPVDAIKAAKRYTVDTYKTLKEEDRVAIKRFQHRNLIFSGEQSLFSYILKSYFLFFYKFQKFEFLEGLKVVQKYYVEQPDGEHRSLYDLNEFDLLVISFTSKPNNVALQDVILEVVKNRFNLGKATWVYSETAEGLTVSKEYSSGIEKYLNEFVKCNAGASFNYEGYLSESQANPAENKKVASKKLATDFN